ncbi:MAG: galactose mutarotase [Oscillospiraceae bacterium]|nr:galactose mutarotase [Oscillospiraceae bacterium]
MSFKKGTYGSLELFTITNKNGMSVDILAAGASIVSLKVPDKCGNLRDVVLGYASGEDYLKPGPCHGAVCGRVANRIENAEFMLNGKLIKVPSNMKGGHMIHGGDDTPLSRRVFTLHSSTDNSVTLRALLPDGENGFPGNMTVDVTYTLSDENGLLISYSASCDKDTVINLTNHAYFNLRGHDTGNIGDHIMTMYADSYAPLSDDNIMVYGALHPLPEEFDFRTPKAIGRDINKNHPQLQLVGGYDHAWTVRQDGKKLVTCTEVHCPESGINMTVKTNSPTVLLYTGNSLPGVDYPGKDGAVYGRHGALCLETGFYPNCLKFPQFGQGYLKRGEVFDYKTEYVFDVK